MMVVINENNRPKALPSVKGGVFGLVFVFMYRILFQALRVCLVDINRTFISFS